MSALTVVAADPTPGASGCLLIRSTPGPATGRQPRRRPAAGTRRRDRHRLDRRDSHRSPTSPQDEVQDERARTHDGAANCPAGTSRSRDAAVGAIASLQRSRYVVGLVRSFPACSPAEVASSPRSTAVAGFQPRRATARAAQRRDRRHPGADNTDGDATPRASTPTPHARPPLPAARPRRFDTGSGAPTARASTSRARSSRSAFHSARRAVSLPRQLSDAREGRPGRLQPRAIQRDGTARPAARRHGHLRRRRRAADRDVQRNRDQPRLRWRPWEPDRYGAPW